MRFSQNDENTTYAVFAPKASIVINRPQSTQNVEKLKKKIRYKKQ